MFLYQIVCQTLCETEKTDEYCACVCICSKKNGKPEEQVFPFFLSNKSDFNHR